MRGKPEIQADIDRLTAMARVRRGKPGFSQNVADIEARIAELRAELEAASV